MKVMIKVTVQGDNCHRVIGRNTAEVLAQDIAMVCLPWEKICAGLVGNAVFQAERELRKTQKEVNIDE